jgi:hypothetical protein
MKALGTLRRRWSSSSGPTRCVAHSDGHLGPHDAAGAQTITDGSFGRTKGDDADAPQPGFVPRVASNNRCGSFSASPDYQRVAERTRPDVAASHLLC